MHICGWNVWGSASGAAADRFFNRFSLPSFSLSLSLAAIIEKIAIVFPHVVLRRLYLRQAEGYGQTRTTSHTERGTPLNLVGDTHHFCVVPSEVYSENAVSEPACACAVRVRFLHRGPETQARGGVALVGVRGQVDVQVVVPRFLRRSSCDRCDSRSSISISCGVTTPNALSPSL